MRTFSKKSDTSNHHHLLFGKRGQGSFLPVQAKLNVGKPHDKYEQEADRVADTFISDSKSNEHSFISPTSLGAGSPSKIQQKPLAQTITPLVQKKEDSTGFETINKIQRQVEEEEEETLQPRYEIQRQEEEEEEVQAKIEIQRQEEEEEEIQPKTNIQRQDEEAEPVQTQPQEEEEEPVQAQPEEEEEEEPVQAQPEEEEEELQASSISGSSEPVSPVASTIESNIQNSRGGGSPIPGDVRTQLEDSFGADFSGVRVHTGSTAENMTRQLRAQAFTNRNNIYFNSGRFNPATQSGQHLLAHELTHTIQQGAVPVNQTNPQGNNQNTSPSSTGRQNTEIATSDNQPEISQNTQENNDAEPRDVARLPSNGGQQQAGGNNTHGTGQTSEQAGGQQSPGTQHSRQASEDAGFQSVRQQIKAEANKQQLTRPASQEAQAAQAAAPSPENERESQAQSQQVETMSQQEPGEFNAESFKARLMQRIENMQLPQNQEEAANFDENNNIDEINQAAQSDASAEQASAAGTVSQATHQEPATESVPEREITPLPQPDTGNSPAPINARQAVPNPLPENEVSTPLQENTQEISQQMAENEITDEQLENSNEPSFTSALNSKKEAQQNAQQAPQQFRAHEQQTLSNNAEQAQNTGSGWLNSMHSSRVEIMNQVQTQQVNTGALDTVQRTRIANKINAIYQATKTDVEKILNDLDLQVSAQFTAGAASARLKFEAHVNSRMSAYKRKRYSGITGAGRWLRDKFMGVPDEVNMFFVEGRQIYISWMDITMTRISQLVAQKLSAAKSRIELGKVEVQKFVLSLPQNLQQIGREAANNIQNKFEALHNSVNEKQDALIDSLAQQYSQSVNAIDARIEEMKAANRGLVDKALDAVKGVINTIITIKNTLTNLLSSALSVIKTIISDPIGFLKNLISGVAQGVKNFGTNILKHLTSGLIAWLTGALGSAGITIPPDLFSLKGIFNLVMQILGLTWDFMRRKAVKLLGEPVVRALETGFEIFMVIKNEGITGLWNYLKEKFTDLKETVIDAIKQMLITKVIEAGIKWILGLMSPAGAFIKAAMMIIDIVKFFIERGRQIIQLVSAFIDGVKAVASGSVSRVAQAIENALARAIPVVIGFLASLLGIGGLASKVQNIIKRIRQRIDRAIDKIILKAQKWFRKAGSKIKSTVSRFFKWWKAKSNFTGNDGKNHKLYFKGEGSSAKLTVASNPTAFSDFIQSVEIGTDKSKQTAKQKALALAAQIDAKKREAVTGANETEKNENSKKKQEELQKLLNSLAKHARILFGTAAGDLPESDIKYESSEKGGATMGTKMTAKILTKKGPAGSVPTTKKHLVFDKLLKRRLGGSSYYIRGHLLNHNTHGPGQWKNMTPLSKEGNRLHESVAESKVKSAVASGAIVYYFVKPVYGRAALNTPENAEPNIKDIRSAEKYVPNGLEVEANLLKSEKENFAKKQTLVPKQTIRNPIDTSLGSYQLSSVSKERVVLTSDSAQKIVENTGGAFTVSSIQEIKNAAEKVKNLNRYDQIKENVSSDALKTDIEKLKTSTNVVLK